MRAGSPDHYDTIVFGCYKYADEVESGRSSDVLPTLCLQKWIFRFLHVEILLTLAEDGLVISIKIVIATLTSDSITVAMVLTSMVPRIPNPKPCVLDPKTWGYSVCWDLV